MELLYGVAIAIAAALLWRVVQWFRDYRRGLRIKLEPVPPVPESELSSFPELGKVRVKPRFAGSGVEEDGEPEVELPPVVIVDAAARRDTSAERVAPTVVPAMPLAPVEEDNVPVLLTPIAPEAAAIQQQDMFADEAIAPPPFPKKEKPRPAQVLYDTPVVEPVRPVRAEPEAKAHVDVQEVIALHVVARQHPFNGEDLLRCILSYGLRFGEMSIFHRHERPTGQGRILFSMAKAVEPGFFDLEAMTGEEVPGVSFFLSLPGVNSIHAYDIMVDTAKRLATELQGEVLDEQQQPLTRQLIEHYRERVQEFERRRLMQRPAE